MSSIRLRCKVFPGAFLQYLCRPRYWIDRYPEQLGVWGENAIPVPPGRHHLRIFFNYLTRGLRMSPSGMAEIVVDVPQGQTVAVEYRTRLLAVLPGKVKVTGVFLEDAPQGGSEGHSPGRLPDPTGRHEHRRWDGQQWGPAVGDRGPSSDDPL